MKKSTKRILASALLALLFAALTLVYALFGEKPVVGSKAITIAVVNSLGEETTYSVKTDALYLAGAMNDAEGLAYEGAQGPYGLMIESVNGERAVYSESGAYWSLSVNGEYGNYGADQQPVEDGDAFVIAYTR